MKKSKKEIAFIKRWNKAYTSALNDLVDEIFRASEEKYNTMRAFAADANIGYSTMLNLNHRVTRLPRFKTVFSLAKAVGLHLKLVDLDQRQKYRVVG